MSINALKMLSLCIDYSNAVVSMSFTGAGCLLGKKFCADSNSKSRYEQRIKKQKRCGKLNKLLGLWWNGHFSRVSTPLRPMTAGIGSGSTRLDHSCCWHFCVNHTIKKDTLLLSHKHWDFETHRYLAIRPSHLDSLSPHHSASLWRCRSPGPYTQTASSCRFWVDHLLWEKREKFGRHHQELKQGIKSW